MIAAPNQRALAGILLRVQQRDPADWVISDRPRSTRRSLSSVRGNRATDGGVKGGAKLDQSGGGKLDHPAARWRV